jgi:serine/threonine-protein kinase
MPAGRPPFQGDDAVSVIAQHINPPPVSPSWHNDRVSAELDALVLRLLARDPDERPKVVMVVGEPGIGRTRL